MKKTKILCMFLCALMLLTVIVGCSKKGPDADTSSNAPAESGKDNSEAEKDNFPLEVKKWDKTIKILTHKMFDFPKYELGMYYDEDGKEAFELIEGDPVRSACYDRIALIAEKFGLKTEVTFVEGLDGPIKRIENDVLTGDTNFDLVAAPIGSITKLGTEKHLHDFNEIKNGYIHLDAPYWDQSAKRDLTIMNRLYYITGDALVSDKAETAAIFYNKDMIKKYNLEDPVKLVDNNEWTLDKFYEMSKAVATKVSSGDKMSFNPEDKDIFGMTLDAFSAFQFMWGFDQRTIQKDDKDLPEMRIDDPRNIKAWQKLSAMLLDESVVGVADFFGAWDSGVYNQSKQIFLNGNALFQPRIVGFVEDKELEESGLKYGILPFPKLDEEQEYYGCAVNSYWMTFLAIPNYNIDNLDATCYLLEAMAYYGHDMVRPEYYDKTLKLKHLEDKDAERMLDLVFAHRTFDLGAIYNWGNMIQFYTQLMGQRSADVVSHFEKNKDVYQEGIDHTVAQFSK